MPYYSRPFLDISVGEMVHDDVTREVRKVVGIEWRNGVVEAGGNSHMACWAVYVENQHGEPEGRHPWEITTTQTEEDQKKELPNCSCSPDAHTVEIHTRYPRKENGRIDFNRTLYKIVCHKCGKCTGEHDMFDMVRIRWIFAAEF